MTTQSTSAAKPLLHPTCQLSRFSRESPSFSSYLPVSLLEHQISRKVPTMAFFQFFFINFVVFEMSKRKIKQMDLVLLFELFLIGKRKTDQPNCYIFNKYCNWSEINQSNCTIHGRSWHCFCMPLSTSGTFGRRAGDFQRVFETLLKFTFLQCKDF